ANSGCPNAACDPRQTFAVERFREGHSIRCHTADGVMLRDTTSDHGANYDLVAVTLDRAPVDLDAVLPPARLFVRAFWGIPDEARL
ncbi:hypothetical protein, partial [Bradyrhizobium sp.]|uniref:hypothetical protein n=1 Tax=Bradyrhizobium sp. TaxID=376 RepID=UPI0025C3D375